MDVNRIISISSNLKVDKPLEMICEVEEDLK